jgi:uncharacterized protein
MAAVAGFNITPVKSTALQQPESIDLREQGAVGDRRFLFARATGERLSGISKAGLMPIHSSYDPAGERLTLAFPDGTDVTGDARGTGSAITVRLFDRSIAGHTIDPVLAASVRERIHDDTLTLVRVDEPEYAGGAHRASIVSRASVADVGTLAGDAGLDPRRFRMLIEVDGCDPYEEDAWQGERLRIGEAIIRLGDRVPRCVMTTLDPDTGEQNAPVLEALAKHRKVGTELVLGVYGDVEQPGVIRVGDPVEPLPG